MSRDKVIKTIKKYNSYLIVSHIDLEGDSLGSQFALKILLEKLGKKTVVANEGSPPPQYNFLDIKSGLITRLAKETDYEAVMVLDCPVIKRIGKIGRSLKKDRVLINIDHHISNSNFGDINWVEPHVSSCGEMIYMLYKALDVPIDYRSALFLYVAILTDTGSFAYENTTSSTHAIVSELIDKGLKPNLIHQALYENRTMAQMKLLKSALSTLKLTKDGKIACMYVSKKMLNKERVALDVTEGFINYARAINGVKVAIIFLENPSKKGQIEISFRSKGEVNVDKLASFFGGGGHKNASGCVLRGSLKDVMKKVLDAIKRHIHI